MAEKFKLPGISTRKSIILILFLGGMSTCFAVDNQFGCTGRILENIIQSERDTLENLCNQAELECKSTSPEDGSYCKLIGEQCEKGKRILNKHNDSVNQDGQNK